MSRGRSSISKAQSYKEIGEFWDVHDLADYWEQTCPADFEVEIQREATYYPLDAVLADRVRAVARRRGISPETLLNLWVQERLQQEDAFSATR
ncbi:MAG: hypothetical protein H5T61_08430 [Thermoflexales bacterium]|nr:hypothetical protein [Thermoflexales bacterium]